MDIRLPMRASEHPKPADGVCVHSIIGVEDPADRRRATDTNAAVFFIADECIAFLLQ